MFKDNFVLARNFNIVIRDLQSQINFFEAAIVIKWLCINDIG